MQILPIRVSKKDAAKALSLSVDGLNKLMLKDPDFPKALKTGTSKQAHVYFDYAELIQWHKQLMNQTA
jgi:hypothetical protein